MGRRQHTPSTPRRSPRREPTAAATRPNLVFRAVTSETAADARAVTRTAGSTRGAKARKISSPTVRGPKSKAAAAGAAGEAARAPENISGKATREQSTTITEPHNTRGRKRKAAAESTAGTAAPPIRTTTGRAAKKAKKTVAVPMDTPKGAHMPGGAQHDAGRASNSPTEGADSREYQEQQGLLLSAEEQTRLLEAAPGAETRDLTSLDPERSSKEQRPP